MTAMALTHNEIPNKTISAVTFTCYSGDEIRTLSEKKATNPHSLDSLQHPTSGGLYDAAYGPVSFNDVCATCGLAARGCPGHLGHIELPLPVYHPLFFKSLYNLVRGSCLQCKQLLINREVLLLLSVQLEALEKGLVQTVYHLKNAMNEAKDYLAHDKSDEIVILEKICSRLHDILKEDAIAMEVSLGVAENLCNGKPRKDWSKHAADLHDDILSEFRHLLTKSVSKCPHCKATVPTVREEHKSKIFYIKKEANGERSPKYMTPTEVRNHIAELWQKESRILSKVLVAMTDAERHSGTCNQVDGSNKSRAVDVFFLDVLSVPPSRFRPMNVVKDQQYESTQTTTYAKIIVDCSIIRCIMKKISEMDTEGNDEDGSITLSTPISHGSMDLVASMPGATLPEKLMNAWHRLQQHVSGLFDGDLDRLTSNKEHRPPGFKQLLEKKGGLFRQNMMGKRVNYAARSVISPDPYIATNEIGVPLVFASKLTYPTPVTPWNVSKLRKAVINGPLVHPGATHVISDGRTIRLSPTDEAQRHAVAKQLIASDDAEPRNNSTLPLPKQVLRHIQTGDVMLLNRQPTLHKGSIMAHKVRVLPGEKTLRLHYANCKSYNADFDGDEMNAHFPQTELARAEAMHLMLTDEQYLSAKDGKPLSSLIQDHMVAGVNMCLRGRFFRREEYHLLLYNALTQLPRKIKLLPPTIMKPVMLWSGKQVISTLLINAIPDGLPLINLTGKSKIGAKHWQTHVGKPPATASIEPGDMCESQVVIRQGELLCGILDKAHYGATEFGLVHATFELYGGEISGRLLSCLARLFTFFLQIYKGFTLGVEDILVTPGADEQRSEIIQENLDGMTTVAKTLNVKRKNNPEDVVDALWDAHVATKLPTNQSEDKLAAVDHAMKKISNSVNDQVANHCTGDGLLKPFPDNNLQLMVISGAKGGMVNCMQISCLLGQIELEGRRPPLMPSGRSVPSFKPYCTSLRSGGFISQRFLTGIRPQEYFHHCMAGREGLVDTAVKTSRSGYLQRSLIKHLEGLLLSYDMTVRDSDGGVLQFMYGEDGIDVTKSAYLQQKQCKFAVDNFEAIKRQLPSMDTVESVFDTSSARRKWKKYNKLKKKRDRYIRRGGADRPRNSAFLEFEKSSDDNETSQIIDEWRKLSKEEQAEYSAKVRKYYLPDPVISHLRPDLYFGSTSEHFHDEMRQYLHRNPAKLSADDDVTIKGLPSLKGLEDLLSLRYQKALCQPGEGVGLLAAQSIGEPSTQMTLNTFHFAGRGEMNVTLGIPRLREILMVASKQIKTPQVTVPVLDGMIKRARRLCKELTKVLLSQVLHKFTLEETLVVEQQSRHRRCVLSISILPEQQFQKDMALSRADVLRHIERRFISQLIKSIAGKLKKRETDVLIQGEKKDTKKRETKEKDVSEENEASLEVEMNYEEEEEEVRVQEDAEEEKDDDDDEMEYEGNEEDVNDDAEMVEENSQAVMEEDDNDNSQEMVNNVPYPDEVKPRLLAVQSLRSGDVFVEDYKFDVTANGWCKITLLMPLLSVNIDLASLVRECASVSAVRKVPGLVRSILVPAQGEQGVMNLVTEGINFYKMFENEDSLDVNRLYCNCVHSVARMYGIEAARCVVVKEIANVFAVYGIQVDRRHLTMIADYMCYEGTYKPFNRAAIRSCVSPLQQMTFETTVQFLNHAALHGLPDDLKSPSSRIVTGQVVNCGTGNFSLVFPVADFA